MKKLFLLFSFLLYISNLHATTQSTSRNLNIDGNVTGQKGASNNTNGGSWENNEVLSGKSGVTWYLSWDNTNLYVGREGGNNGEPILIYIQADYSGAQYTDNSSGQIYDNTKGFFPTTGDPNWGTNGGVNFVAYIKSSYDEFRTYNGSSWSGANTSLTPQFTVQGSTHNMEVSIPWNSITNGNGAPNYFRIVFFHTNGSGGGSGSYVYGASPNSSNTPNDGNQTTATFRDWWGGYTVTAGEEPNSVTGGPLPVTLTSFNAFLIGDKVHLNWSTATEINNYGFEIERVKGDPNTNKFAHWERIGFVQGNGNSNSVKIYSFEDKNVLTGQYAYRLKQINYDGSYEYSDVVKVDVKLKPSVMDVKNFPNPFNPTTKVRYEIPYDGLTLVKVYDILGNEITTLINEYKDAGIYEAELDGSKLSNGIYLIKLQVGNFTKVTKAILIK
jgi:hypothetical protein